METLHRRMVKKIRSPMPRGSVRMMLDGVETPVMAERAHRVSFSALVDAHADRLSKRGHALPAEAWMPVGQAAHWHGDVVLSVPRSGRQVARQIARLCRKDSQVTVPLRSLAEAVGQRDRAGRLVAYTERGIEVLTDAGWLRTESVGSGPRSVTTYFLMPGDHGTEWFPEDADEWDDLRD